MPSVPWGPITFTRYAAGFAVELVDDRAGYRWKPTPAERRLPLQQQDYRSRVYENSIPKLVNPRRDGGRSEGYPPPVNSIPWLAEVANQTISSTGDVTGSYCAAAYAKAYRKLQDRLFGDTASMGVSVAEGREAINGIVERATRLGKAYKSLRRGRFKEFLRQLAARPKERHKHTNWTRPKDASALWLEYWLAWAPLVGDIFNSTKVLTEPNLIPPTIVSVRSSCELPSETLYKGVGYRRDIVRGAGRVSVGLGCKAQVTNPNAYLAARLGLTQFYQIAWAVVPFSFIVDWFANIGQILASMSFKNCGLILTDTWISSNARYTGDREYNSRSSDSSEQNEKWKQSYVHVRRSRRVRTPGTFPRPPLVVKLPDGLSPSRGATAISLLVSIFTKG